MKFIAAVKHWFMVAVIVSFTVGCANQPMQEETNGVTAAEALAAIESAEAKIGEAAKADALWRDTESILADAKKAYDDGNYAEAKMLADKARMQAESALAQKASEEARLGSDNAAGAAATMGGASSYTVMSGDSLWRISASSDIYGNPYKWPLIYKANRDKIRDADLIYPGQVFNIRQDWSASEVDAAVNHARNRGAWSLGTVESSDQAYLAR